jgi:hypothetical protein
MPQIIRQASAINWLLPLLFASTTSGCFTWRYETQPVPEVVHLSPKRLWVPVGADSNVILMAPRIVNDTLTGYIEGSAPGGQALRVFAEPVAGISRVATERPNFGYGMRNGLGFAVMLGALVLGASLLGPVR